GVPLIAPAVLNERPWGKLPVVTVHVYPPLPPDAASVCEYVTPTVPSGSDAVVMVTAAGSMVRARSCVSLALRLPVTGTVKFEVPAAAGVPLIVPLALKDNPCGKLPAVSCQE